MTKHTPGPWTEGQPVGGFSGTTIQTSTETIAHHVDDKNAALIAAAPELLAALESLAGWALHAYWYEISGDLAGIIDNANAAITKAKEGAS